jgi:hypothetical protein
MSTAADSFKCKFSDKLKNLNGHHCKRCIKNIIILIGYSSPRVMRIGCLYDLAHSFFIEIEPLYGYN